MKRVFGGAMALLLMTSVNACAPGMQQTSTADYSDLSAMAEKCNEDGTVKGAVAKSDTVDTAGKVASIAGGIAAVGSVLPGVGLILSSTARLQQQGAAQAEAQCRYFAQKMKVCKDPRMTPEGQAMNGCPVSAS